MVQVRASEPNDTQAIAAVILPIQQVEFGIPITLEAQPDLSNIEQFYRHGCGNFWVAEVDGQVVGTIALLDISNNEAALRKMFVAAPFRGREFGIAQSLLSKLVAWAALHGVASIYLGTTAKFLAAHRFYEKNGFAEVAKSTLPQTFPVMSVDTKFYRLSLSANAA
ncbi:GNAT family N-acetyltransferase [Piscinibacter defluvii]|uniref:GNAT family N-acetyltransferase n=1 Tax=Piscinibacter defluvii TaxID=1796922 RepID=UPI000FDE9987|nr:GNAT family N-acetyltransferase [Piscinibacter defluvii]